MTKRAPVALGVGGRRLWAGVNEDHDLDVGQEAQLLEACRAKDRLDKMDLILRGPVSTWPAGMIDKANVTANVMKQLLAALRLPDEVTGKRPQAHRPHGAQRPTIAGGNLSSLDRARANKTG